MDPKEWQTNDTINDLLTQRRDGAVVLAGRYQIVRKLGEGGMGSVWLAEDRKLDGRQVAIKMLPVVLATSARAIQQLKAEAKLAMQLSHSNIVTLRSFEDSDEGAFLVMDYVPGKTLEKMLEEKETLTEDEVLKIFRPIAEALDYAHRHKVVHRDVKPSNVMVREDGEPFIMDFGIAREMKDTLTRTTGRDSSGSLPWMSPEQLRGEDPAPAQDIYSLAATMYECLAGHPPFYRGDIRYQIPQVAPPPLTSTSPLATAVMAGLAKEPGQRPMTAGAIFGHGNKQAMLSRVVASSSRGETIPERQQAPPVHSSSGPTETPAASAQRRIYHFPGLAYLLSGLLLGSAIGAIGTNEANIIGGCALGLLSVFSFWTSRSVAYAAGSVVLGMILLVVVGENVNSDEFCGETGIAAIPLALIPVLLLGVLRWAWRRDLVSLRPEPPSEPVGPTPSMEMRMSRKAIYVRVLFCTPICFPAYLVYGVAFWVVWVFLGGWIYLGMKKKPKISPNSTAFLVFWPLLNPVWRLVNLGSLLWTPFVWCVLYYFKEVGLANDLYEGKSLLAAPLQRTYETALFDQANLIGGYLEDI